MFINVHRGHMADLDIADALRGLQEETETLYSVIRLVSSSLELLPMLQGIIEIATDATDCHACFIYLLDGDRLTIRAASPVFADAVGRVELALTEGLTGWVARHRKPEYIRERALEDPRMRYVPLLQEERFQSMVAVPILSRAGETIGVIVLHTEAPREFTPETMTLLAHIASLVSGAIENAQSYDRERRRADVLTGLSSLAHDVSASADVEQLGRIVTGGARRLLDGDRCTLYLLERGGAALAMVARDPAGVAGPVAASPADPLLDPTLLTVPLVTGGDHVGLLCAKPRDGHGFDRSQQEVARAIAHQSAVAIRRIQLIDGLTKTNTVKDLFEALSAGATDFAAVKAAAVGCDLEQPYLLVCAEPAGGGKAASGPWRSAAERLGRGLQQLAPRAAVEAGPGPVRAVLPLDPGASRLDSVTRACRQLGHAHGAVIGMAQPRRARAHAARALREAQDAATIGRVLMPDGGAVGYPELGAYRYLVRISPEDAPHDRMRAAVDQLIDYDRRRRTALVETLERYLAERRSVIDSARALYIHPNTLRQRLARIERVSGISLDEDDLLSLELAIKLARLHHSSGTDEGAQA
jgi:GAF domain-containing protein